VLRTNCRGFTLCLSFNEIFICEISVRGEDRLQGILTMFLCVILVFICKSIIRCEDRVQGIYTIYL
jgi:hypothetical protein